MTEVESAAPKGQIYDLGYKRYAGPRRAASTRWRVVMRNQITTSWKTWWRYKAALSTAVLVTFIAGGVTIVFKDRLFSAGLIKNITSTLADATLPRSIAFYTRAAFLFSLTVGSRVIASDTQTGAFVFYFSRSLRPRDYVFGKIAGLAVLTSTLVLAGPLVLAVTRLCLAEDAAELRTLWPLVPKAIAIGLLGTLVFSTVPLMFSAIVRSARSAMAIWIAYYLLLGGMLSMIGTFTRSWVGALDLSTALDTVAFKMFDVTMFNGRSANVPLVVAVLSIALHVIASIIAIFVAVKREHGAGVGGAS